MLNFFFKFRAMCDLFVAGLLEWKLLLLVFLAVSSVLYGRKHFKGFDSNKFKVVEIERINNVEKLKIGEGPHWDVATQSLYFVDVRGPKILKYERRTGRVISKKTNMNNDAVTFIVPVKDKPDHFVIGEKLSLVLIHWDTEKNEILSRKELVKLNEPASHRLNDGKCDAQGRLWFGTMTDGRPLLQIGSFYSYSPAEGLKTHINGTVWVSNGIAISEDNSKFWYIDSLKYTVDEYDFDIKGAKLSEAILGRPFTVCVCFCFPSLQYTCRKRVYSNLHPTKIAERLVKEVINITKLPDMPETSLPDGMTIDTDGNLWVAIFNGNQVLKVNPVSGKVLMSVRFPLAHQITSVSFGGPELDELYVTSADEYNNRSMIEKFPRSGSLYRVIGLGVHGRRGNDFVL